MVHLHANSDCLKEFVINFCKKWYNLFRNDFINKIHNQFSEKKYQPGSYLFSIFILSDESLCKKKSLKEFKVTKNLYVAVI